MIAQLADPGAAQASREPRTSLFVMATIYSDGGSAPVKVRDLSDWGALIEGQALPGRGQSVRLCRGPLAADGEIVWAQDGRAGLRFAAAIAVGKWLPSGKALNRQQRVDEVVQQLRVVPASGAPGLAVLPSTVSATDLITLRVAIESLADDLAADADVVKRHMIKLQTLDLAAQALRKLTAGY